MNQGEGGNYFHHHQNLPADNNNYEYGDFVQNYVPLGLEVPNTRLYSENNSPVYEETNLRNSQYYYHQSPPLDLEADVRYLNNISAAPRDYYNENYQNAPVYFQQAKSKFSQYDDNYPPEEPSSTNNYYQETIDEGNNCKYCEYKKNFYPELYQRELLHAAKESEYYAEESRKKAQKMPKASKKYPVTVKMSKFVKNPNPTKPSALCLPVVTQPLARRKSKTNQQQTKKNFHPQPEGFIKNDPHSQGDVKNLDEIENLLDKLANGEPDDETFEEKPQSLAEKNRIKELTKYLKPKIPSSIRFKQQQQAVGSESKSSSYEPRLKISMDKLLSRLQKCENFDDEVSPRSSKTEQNADNKVDSMKNSYNYEELSKKSQKKVEDLHTVHINQLHPSSAESLENKKLIKSLDDNCALDLHRSKSYIVDLIDKALSKELGTIPRGQSIHHKLSPQQAITTISRHRNELTPKFADSFASAPVAGSSRMVFEKSASDGQIKKTTSGIDCYVKQLKQLRWGHIRHIQHEAKQLADLEEFLENCGEMSD